MAVWELIVREMFHRKLNFLLSALAVLGTVALFVAFLTTAEGSKRETVRVTRDVGFNLRIIPKETDMDGFWARGYSEETMPEETVERFAKYDKVFLSYNHLVATLQRRVTHEGREVLLTGLARTITAPAQSGRPLGYDIRPGTVIVGFQVGQRLGLQAGGALELSGQRFSVERVLVESGTEDDIRVYGSLRDVQRALGLEGRINEIKAIDCLCLTTEQNPLKILRAELEKALPEAKVIQLRAIADARARQRQTADRYFGFMSPFLLVVCAAWVGVLAVLNVRERRAEIGLLRALGHGSERIAALFLGKAVVIGVAGAALGWMLGSALALHFGADIFQVTSKAMAARPALLWQALVAAPIFAALASFIPAMLAVTLDPAETLRET